MQISINVCRRDMYIYIGYTSRYCHFAVRFSLDGPTIQIYGRKSDNFGTLLSATVLVSYKQALITCMISCQQNVKFSTIVSAKYSAAPLQRQAR